MNNFVAIDFETANGQRSSVCSVGVVAVRDGAIVDSFYSLIKPRPNYYAWFCQEVHGLDYDDTDNAPDFPEVWKQVEAFISRNFPNHQSSIINPTRPSLPTTRPLMRAALKPHLPLMRWSTPPTSSAAPVANHVRYGQKVIITSTSSQVTAATTSRTTTMPSLMPKRVQLLE